jgi:hypothetical protein
MFFFILARRSRTYNREPLRNDHRFHGGFALGLGLARHPASTRPKVSHCCSHTKTLLHRGVFDSVRLMPDLFLEHVRVTHIRGEEFAIRPICPCAFDELKRKRTTVQVKLRWLPGTCVPEAIVPELCNASQQAMKDHRSPLLKSSKNYS